MNSYLVLKCGHEGINFSRSAFASGIICHELFRLIVSFVAESCFIQLELKKFCIKFPLVKSLWTFRNQKTLLDRFKCCVFCSNAANYCSYIASFSYCKISFFFLLQNKINSEIDCRPFKEDKCVIFLI